MAFKVVAWIYVLIPPQTMQERVFKHVFQVIVCPNVYYCSALENPSSTDSPERKKAIYKPFSASESSQNLQLPSWKHS